MTVGSAQQQAEKVAADLTALAAKLDRLRDRPDWSHDDVIAPALEALTAAATSTAQDRAQRRAAADEERQLDLDAALRARSPYRTVRGDARTGGPRKAAQTARAAVKARAAEKG